MTPLSPEEQTAIVSAFRTLAAVTVAQAIPAVVRERYQAFQRAYRGESRAFVDAWPDAADKLAWVAQLHAYLKEEIPSDAWGQTPAVSPAVAANGQQGFVIEHPLYMSIDRQPQHASHRGYVGTESLVIWDHQAAREHLRYVFGVPEQDISALLGPEPDEADEG